MKELVKWASVLNLNLSSLIDKRLKEFEINSGQFFYLLKICRNPGMTREEIFREVYRNPSNISRALAQLEKKGYLTKKPSGTDRRTCYLYPTKKAEKVYREIEKSIAECNEEVTEFFSEEEKKVFAELLKKAALHAVEMNVREKGGALDE